MLLIFSGFAISQMIAYSPLSSRSRQRNALAIALTMAGDGRGGSVGREGQFSDAANANQSQHWHGDRFAIGSGRAFRA